MTPARDPKQGIVFTLEAKRRYQDLAAMLERGCPEVRLPGPLELASSASAPATRFVRPWILAVDAGGGGGR